MSVPGRYPLLVSGLGAALLLAYLAGNGRVPLFDRDEPRYALTSGAMLDSGDWVVPRLMDEVRTAKPPAIYWLQAAAMHLFGFNEFAVRLPGAIGCAATVAFLAISLPPLVGRRRAAWACFTFGTSVLVLGVAKVGVIDGVLVLCAAAMQVALLRLSLRRGSDELSAVVLWVAVGCAGLLKGPVILGVLASTLIAWWALGIRAKRDYSRGGISLRRLRPLLGVGLVTLICAPWLYLITEREPTFITTALWHDVATRSVQGLEGHGQLPGFHLLSLFATWFPWSVLLPGAIIEAWPRRQRPHLRFALAACLGPWLMFEIVITKLPHYLLVIFPMLALLTADWIARYLPRLRQRRSAPQGMRVAAVIYAGVALAFAAAPLMLGAASAIATTLALAWGVGLSWSWWGRRLKLGVLIAGIGSPMLVGVAYVGWLGRAPILTVSKRTARALSDFGAHDAAMVHYREPSLAWYAHRAGVVARETAPAVLDSDQFAFAVSTNEAWSQLPLRVRQQWQVLGGVRARLYNERMEVQEVLVLGRVPSADLDMTE